MRIPPVAVALCLGVFVLTAAAAAPRPAPRRTAKPQPKLTVMKTAVKKPAQPAPPKQPMTVEEARMTVRMLDDAYQLFLEEIHAAYPTKPGRPVAATIIRDVQKIMGEKGWPNSRFMAVNAILMNLDHQARDEWEKDAVKVLRKQYEPLETVDNGELRAATVVPLGSGCTSCHWVGAGQTSRAAIIWRIPVREESAAEGK